MNRDIKSFEGNLVAVNGDLGVMDSDSQHIEDTITASPGYWKQNPQDGVGIRNYSHSPANAQELSKIIRLQLESDGYKVNNPTITQDAGGKLIINPNATI